MSALVPFTLGGFLALLRAERAGALGAWDPKVIKGEKKGPVTRYREGWREKRTVALPLAFSANYGGVPSHDPMTYVAGFGAALRGQKMPESYLGSEFARGYAHGMRVASGDEEMPGWIIEQRRPPVSAPSRGERRYRVPRATSGGQLGSVKATIARYAAQRKPLDCVPLRSHGAVWSDGATLYSYKQPIARKKSFHPLVVWLEPRRFSKTTSNHRSRARYELEMNGWTVVVKELD